MSSTTVQYLILVRVPVSCLVKHSKYLILFVDDWLRLTRVCLAEKVYVHICHMYIRIEVCTFFIYTSTRTKCSTVLVSRYFFAVVQVPRWLIHYYILYTIYWYLDHSYEQPVLLLYHTKPSNVYRTELPTMCVINEEIFKTIFSVVTVNSRLGYFLFVISLQAGAFSSFIHDSDRIAGPSSTALFARTVLILITLLRNSRQARTKYTSIYD